jgi:hypothetical protein
MENLTAYITRLLKDSGADLVGIGDLRGLPAEIRQGLPVGISVAVAYPAEVIVGIAALPTQEYSDWYDTLNARLEEIVTLGEAKLIKMGYKAYAQTV